MSSQYKCGVALVYEQSFRETRAEILLLEIAREMSCGRSECTGGSFIDLDTGAIQGLTLKNARSISEYDKER